MYKFFLSVDATQVEINPFGETPQGEVVCFDAKINFDDNAMFRQKDVSYNLILYSMLLSYMAAALVLAFC